MHGRNALTYAWTDEKNRKTTTPSTQTKHDHYTDLIAPKPTFTPQSQPLS